MVDVCVSCPDDHPFHKKYSAKKYKIALQIMEILKNRPEGVNKYELLESCYFQGRFPSWVDQWSIRPYGARLDKVIQNQRLYFAETGYEVIWCRPCWRYKLIRRPGDWEPLPGFPNCFPQHICHAEKSPKVGKRYEKRAQYWFEVIYKKNRDIH